MKNICNTKNNTSDVVMLTYIFISALSLLTIIIRIDNNSYGLIWLLPMSYLISTIVFYFVSKEYFSVNGIVVNSMHLVVFIRFVITPLSMVLTGKYTGLGFGPEPSKQLIDFGIGLMIYELFTVYFVIALIMKYYYRKRKLQTSDFPRSCRYLFINQRVVLLFLLIFLPVVLANISEASTSVHGIVSIATDMSRLSIYLLIISKLKRKYDDHSKLVWSLIAIAITGIFLTSLISMSRWTLLFNSVCCIYLISELFPRISKWLYVVMAGALVVIILAVSIKKFSWALIDSTNPYRDIIGVVSGQFQEYFSGPRVVAQSIGMKQSFRSDITLITFINDFTGSIPGLSRYVDQADRINVYFNRYLEVGNITHIIPMIGQGYSYFSILAPMFSAICSLLAMILDYYYQKTPYYELSYVYLFMGLLVAMFMGFNTQIIWGNFLANFLPVYLLFYVNSKLRLGSGKNLPAR